MRVLDLFAGMGGWEASGLDTVGLELDPWACATRRAAGLATIRTDVATYPLHHLAGKVEGLIASPPCQDWSRAGKRAKDTTERGQLVWQPLRWALHLRPRWVALEQVPDVLEVWEETAWRLGQNGYATWFGILNAADYGVPQTRQRAILIASLDRKVHPPEPTHSDQRRGMSLFGLAPWVSMAEALGWRDVKMHKQRGAGMTERYGLRPGRDATEPSFAVTAGTKGSGPRLLLRNNTQANAATRSPDEPAPTVFFGGRLNDMSWVVRAGQTNANGPDFDGRSRPVRTVASDVTKWVATRPATTVQGDPPAGRPGHKHRENGEGQFDQQAVRITLQEALILQGFPPDYPVQGTKTARFTQVGNAIPPPLAAAIIGAANPTSPLTRHKEGTP